MKRLVPAGGWWLPAALLLACCGEKEEAAAPRTTGEETVERSRAEQLLQDAHFVTAWTDRDLSGKLRSEDRAFAVGLSRRGNDTQLTYRNPEEGGPVRLHARLVEGRYEIYEMVGGKTWRCTPGRLTESVGGTDFAHEDLMMPWMFWPGAELLGEERITGQKTWKIRVENPSAGGQYRFVEAWVHGQHGGLVQAVGYDSRGRAVMRFRVTSVPAVGGERLEIRRGRLDRFDPESSNVVATSVLEFGSPELMGAAD